VFTKHPFRSPFLSPFRGEPEPTRHAQTNQYPCPRCPQTRTLLTIVSLAPKQFWSRPRIPSYNTGQPNDHDAQNSRVDFDIHRVQLLSRTQRRLFQEPTTSIDLPSLLDHQIETVTDLAPPSLLDTTDTLDEISIVEAVEAVAKTRAVPTTEAVATTAGTGGDANSADHCPNRASVARSHLSSVGSLTLASSSETLAAKTSNVARSLMPASIITSPPPPPKITTTATKAAKMTTKVTSRSVSMAVQRQRYLENARPERRHFAQVLKP